MISVGRVRTVIDRREMRRLLHSHDGMVPQDIRRRAIVVQMAAKTQVGRRTGRLRRSIHVEMRVVPVTVAYVGSNVRYAYMHHEGTRAHAIKAKPGRKLVFTSRGRRVFATKVLHPGTKPNRYLTDKLILAVR